MQKIIATFFILLSLITQAYGVDDLPKHTLVNSEVGSLDATIFKILLSFPFNSSDPRVVYEPDLIQATANNMSDFIDGKSNDYLDAAFGKYNWTSLPAHRKVMFVKAFEIGDRRVTAQIKRGKAAKLGRVLVISHGSIYFKGQFQAGEKMNSRFDPKNLRRDGDDAAKYTPGADAMLDLLTPEASGGGGFVPNQDGIYSLALSPMQNSEFFPMEDLMHEKQVGYGILDESGQLIAAVAEDGSNNFIDNPRINERVLDLDEIRGKRMFAEAEAMAKVFRAGEPMNKIPYANPERVVYRDRSIREGAFTNGQFNPNIRTARILNGVAGLTEDGKPATPEQLAELWEKVGFKVDSVSSVRWRHFVITYARGFNATEAAANKNPHMEVRITADGQFLYPLGFGLVGAAAGYPVVPPSGRVTYPWKKALRRQVVEAIGYQKDNPRHPDTDPFGAPLGRTVMHLKVTIMEAVIEAKPKIIVFRGSLNYSNHEENGEYQEMLVFDANSPLAKAYVSALDQIKDDKSAAVPLELGIFREIQERLIGNSLFEISVEWLNEQLELAKDRNFKLMAENIIAKAELKSVVKKKVPIEVVRARVDSMMKFLTWYDKQGFFYSLEAPQRLALVTMASLRIEELIEKDRKSKATEGGARAPRTLSEYDLRPLKVFLRSLVFSSDLIGANHSTDEAKLEARIAEAWSAMQIPFKMPPPYQPAEVKPKARPLATLTAEEPPKGELARTVFTEFLQHQPGANRDVCRTILEKI